MRAFSRLWDTITRERYGITDPARRRFRYGVQVNSLGLTEAQPENNIQRIVLEMLAVTLSPAPGPAPSSCPPGTRRWACRGPADQQWSLRIQQVLAYESDLLEYGDLFDGSAVVQAKTEELLAGAEAEIATVAGMGGVIAAVESGYLKAQLVASHAARRARIESGEDKVVGVNCFQATEPSPLTADADAVVHQRGPGLRARGAGRPGAVAGAARRGRRAAWRWPGSRPTRSQDAPGRQPDGRDPGLRPGGCDHRRVVFRAAGGVRRVPRAHRRRRRPGGGRRAGRGTGRGPRGGARHGGARSGRAGCACCSASPAWTGTPTVSSRSPSGPATPGSR